MIVKMRNAKTMRALAIGSASAFLGTAAGMVLMIIDLISGHMNMILSCSTLGLLVATILLCAASMRYARDIADTTQKVYRHFGLEHLSKRDPFVIMDIDRICALPNIDGNVRVTNQLISSNLKSEIRKIDIVFQQ